MTVQILTQDYLKSILDYDPESGIFTWIPRDIDSFATALAYAGWSARFSGARAGTIGTCGYLSISIGEKSYRAHRLAFLWMEGAFPDLVTDHINGIESDNRWANLRDVTRQENMRNQKRRKNNKSGITGVYFDKASGKWRADITVGGGKKAYLGRFISSSLAAQARRDAEVKYGFHHNHGRVMPEPPA